MALHVVHEALGKLSGLYVERAGLGRDGESLRHREAELAHLPDPRALASEEAPDVIYPRVFQESVHELFGTRGLCPHSTVCFWHFHALLLFPCCDDAGPSRETYCYCPVPASAVTEITLQLRDDLLGPRDGGRAHGELRDAELDEPRHHGGVPGRLSAHPNPDPRLPRRLACLPYEVQHGGVVGALQARQALVAPICGQGVL